jgi:hypothetical protein
MVWKSVTAIVLVAVVGTGLGLYTLLLLFTEDLYTQKGTYAYYVTISSPTIKYFPRIQLTEEEDYYSSCGDGPKLPANGIRYGSTQKPDVLKQTIEAYLLKRGFIKETDEMHGGEYAQPGSKVSLHLMIMPEANGVHRVVVTESYAWD